MNYLLFFSAFIGVFVLLNMYISKRLIAKLDISDKNRLYLRIFLLINLIGILCYMLARYYVNTPSWLYFEFSFASSPREPFAADTSTSIKSPVITTMSGLRVFMM